METANNPDTKHRRDDTSVEPTGTAPLSQALTHHGQLHLHHHHQAKHQLASIGIDMSTERVITSQDRDHPPQQALLPKSPSSPAHHDHVSAQDPVALRDSSCSSPPPSPPSQPPTAATPPVWLASKCTEPHHRHHGHNGDDTDNKHVAAAYPGFPASGKVHDDSSSVRTVTDTDTCHHCDHRVWAPRLPRRALSRPKHNSHHDGPQSPRSDCELSRNRHASGDLLSLDHLLYFSWHQLNALLSARTCLHHNKLRCSQSHHRDYLHTNSNKSMNINTNVNVKTDNHKAGSTGNTQSQGSKLCGFEWSESEESDCVSNTADSDLDFILGFDVSPKSDLVSRDSLPSPHSHSEQTDNHQSEARSLTFQQWCEARHKPNNNLSSHKSMHNVSEINNTGNNNSLNSTDEVSPSLKGHHGSGLSSSAAMMSPPFLLIDTASASSSKSIPRPLAFVDHNGHMHQQQQCEHHHQHQQGGMCNNLNLHALCSKFNLGHTDYDDGAEADNDSENNNKKNNSLSNKHREMWHRFHSRSQRHPSHLEEHQHQQREEHQHQQRDKPRQASHRRQEGKRLSCEI